MPIGEWMPLDQVIPWEKNPRKNDGTPVAKVAESISRFGFVAPIVIWRSKGRMVAGHTRLKALQSLLAKDVTFIPPGAPASGVAPVRFHEFKDEREADLYAIADNKLGELAKWNDDAVSQIIEEHSFTPEEMSVGGLDEYIPLEEGGAENDDVVPEPPKVAKTKLGDVWLLGAHRLICGDSTKPEVLAALLGGAKVDLLWTDPPYNVSYGIFKDVEEAKALHRRTDGKVVANDEMTDEQFRAFLVAAFASADAQMKRGAAFYIASPPGHTFYEFETATRAMPWKHAQTIVWVKDRFVMGRQDYHWRHETILYGWKDGAGHHMLEDRTQDTVWEFPRPGASKEHPTMKPVELIERAIRNSTDAGGIVLDPFGGSGSTLIAAAKNDRTAFLCELDPRYCDVIIARWERQTGKTAVRA